MNKLPDVCKDCAEYGSDFCNDCINEIAKDLPEPDKIVFSKVIRNIARMTDEALGSSDSKNSKK